jgi:NitT/TauT family transport system permease protein
MLGVTSIPQHYKRSSLSLGVNERQMLRHVVLPAAMPSILTGMTLGMGITWNQLVAAEMLAGGSGIGYQLWYFYINQNFPNVIMYMIIIGAIGYLFSMTIRFVGSRYLKWTMQIS